MDDPSPAPVVRKRFWRGLLLASPLVVYLSWLLVNYGYARYEIWELDRRVDDSAIPGYVAAKDSRNDWPFGGGKGTYVRVHWLIVSDDGDALAEFVNNLRLPRGVEAGLYDLGRPPWNMEREATSTPGKCQLYLMTVGQGRGPYPEQGGQQSLSLFGAEGAD